jgi:2-(1,2-epoxy-1,2-dihydrophenyl)acetyl-CoA isomerase
MSYSAIQFEMKNRVAVITLNRPESLNSVNDQMSAELIDAIWKVADDENVRAVILTGAGRGFCAGEDLTTVKEDTSPAKILTERYNDLIMKMRSMPKPLIAAVNGAAAGAGVSLALACDLVYASELASFTQAFVRLGLIPDAGGCFFFTRRLTLGKAMELSFTGRRTKAAEAERIGLVDRVFPAPQLLPQTLKVASELASFPPLAIATAKDLLTKAASSDLATVLALETDAQERLSHTEDFREGVRAFLEKRQPVFKGR